MTKLTNPTPLWLNARGNLLDAGFVYIGVEGEDPQSSPITVFADQSQTIPLAQPLRTQGGVIVNNGAPVFVYFTATDYSLRVRDADGNQVLYLASAREAEPEYQPLDSDLTAIAALSTTMFGRSLLTAANAAALRSLAGIADALPLAGGTVTGAITRQAAGGHWFWNNPGLTNARVFDTASGAADPMTQPGQVWIERVP